MQRKIIGRKEQPVEYYYTLECGHQFCEYEGTLEKWEIGTEIRCSKCTNHEDNIKKYQNLIEMEKAGLNGK